LIRTLPRLLLERDEQLQQLVKGRDEQLQQLMKAGQPGSGSDAPFMVTLADASLV
jgi:alpha-D-ribose 1-methylphosphonate 5-triphosphate synthase subunit PhnI